MKNFYDMLKLIDRAKNSETYSESSRFDSFDFSDYFPKNTSPDKSLEIKIGRLMNLRNANRIFSDLGKLIDERQNLNSALVPCYEKLLDISEYFNMKTLAVISKAKIHPATIQMTHEFVVELFGDFKRINDLISENIENTKTSMDFQQDTIAYLKKQWLNLYRELALSEIDLQTATAAFQENVEIKQRTDRDDWNRRN